MIQPASANGGDVALAHDYLIPMGGAERVVATLHRFWPNAPIYTSAVNRDGLLPDLREADIRTTWMQRLPGIRGDFRRYFALYPLAFYGMPPVRSKVLVVSASTFAKCIRPAPECTSICYCHAPTRFLWENSEYLLREIGSVAVRWAIRAYLPILRRIDYLGAQRMDVMVANSKFVQAKILKAYDQDALVIHPPVEVDRFAVAERHDGFYLIASRLVGYKGIDHAIAGCERLGRQLIVIGDGPDRARLQKLAGEHVRFLGKVSDAVLRDHLQRCRAFIFPGVEDFGIAPVEAQACGKPVVALGKGGALETVVPGETGVWFDEQTPESLMAALRQVETIRWSPARIRRNAENFSSERFEEKMRDLVALAMDDGEVRTPAAPRRRGRGARGGRETVDSRR